MTAGAATEGSRLTNAQQLIWASQELHPESPLYNMAFLFDIAGPISVPDFRRAFAALVGQCDALRTVVDGGAGTVRQRVLDELDYEVPLVDLSGEADPERAARRWAEQRVGMLFEPGERLFDSALLKLAEARFVWFFNQHHLVTDAWSSAVIFERMVALYRAAQSTGEGPAAPLPPFAGYAAYEATVAPAEVAVSARPAPALYGRRRADVGTANTRLTHRLSTGQNGALGTVADRPGFRALTPDLTRFRIFATALFAYLYRVSGQTRLTIGAPAHNRATAEFRQSAGLFMELYPLEVEVDPADTFTSLAGKVARSADVFMRSARPGGSSAGVNRGINTVLNVIRGSFGDFAGHPVHAEWLHPGHVDAEHHLRLQVHDFNDTGRPELLFDCNREVFGDAWSEVPEHFLAVFEALLEDPDQPIGSVDLLSAPGRGRVVEAVNRDTASVPVPGSVVEWFLEWAGRDPAAPAMRSGSTVWSYGELEVLTARVAGAVEPGSVVGVCLPRSAEAVVAILGILRAGAAYVPVDPAWPTSRISFVLGDAGCSLVIADRAETFPVPVALISDLMNGAAAESVVVELSDLAYVLYTSGSTGEPKGVMIEHGSLANYVGWAADFYDAGDRLVFPLFTPLTFDLTVTSLFVPLVSGGSIVVYPESAGPADTAVQQVFADDLVDIVKLTPSHLALLPAGDFSQARIGQLILGGEDLTTAVAGRVHARFGGRVRIHNEYGPTEATVGCVVHTYDPDVDRGGSVPIGRPIQNTAAYVLDGGGHPVPFGAPGELFIAGGGLARGYVGRPDLTAERFVAGASVGADCMYATGDLARVRPNGIIEYLGRTDDQVKVRGARVELGEVEAALAAHPRVTAAAARVWERAPGAGPGELVHCARCGLASDYPGVSFDAARVCNHCRAFETYRDKAQVYFKPMDELEAVLASRRDGPDSEYDCLTLLSGGKDSTYVLCRLVDMGLRVLAFTLDNGYISDQAKANIRRVVEALGVDHIFATTPAMNEIFVDSLQRHANVCNGCFKTIYTLSLQTAREKGIPFIVTGLSRGQFFETRLTEELFTELTVDPDQIDANVLETRKAYHQVDDAAHRLLDTSIFDDDTIFDEVQFVDFYRYCDVGLDELYAYLTARVPWVRPSDTGRSTNCRINDVGIYFHRKTQGFHNYALPYSWDVRMGHKTRDEALTELDDDIDLSQVQQMLQEIGYPEDFTDIESGRRLVGYYAADQDLPATELRTHMGQALPDQMVPTLFVRVDALPLTLNGKIDRTNLPEPGTQRPDVEEAFIAPSTDTETRLAAIWEDVLGIHGIGIRDNFFDLGGDSIMAIQIVARTHRAGYDITLHQLFETLTIEGLGRAVQEGAAITAPGTEEAFSGIDPDELERVRALLGSDGP